MDEIVDEVKIQEAKLLESWLSGHWYWPHSVTIEVHPDPQLSRTAKCKCGETLAIRIQVSDDGILVKGTVILKDREALHG